MTKPACEDAFIIKHRHLKNCYHSFTIGPFSRAGQCRPGNFVHVRLPSSGVFFRRAMSVADVDETVHTIEIIFKVYGRGTSAMANYSTRARLNILGPLGRSFSQPRKHETALIVAGGIGFPPLYYLAKKLVKKGFNPKQILFFYGGRTASDIIERSRIRKLGVTFKPATDDGTYGRQGLVTEAVEEYIIAHRGETLRLYGCGPDAMLKATDDLGMRYAVPGELSLEAPMPCGIGVCLGCIVPLRKGGHARVCCDGPVFNIGEVIL